MTGHTDFDSAMAAVNDEMFSNAFKPCPPERLIKVLNDGLEQHDLVRSKRIFSIRLWGELMRPNLYPPLNHYFWESSESPEISNDLAEILEVQMDGELMLRQSFLK